MPSSWEGFGNPVAEAMLAERPVAWAAIPCSTSCSGSGLAGTAAGRCRRVARFLRDPEPALLERNRAIVGHELSLRDLPARLATLFAR